MKIYIAGKMRGCKCFNFEQFFYWAALLRREGHEPVNPAENDVDKLFDGWQWSDDKYPDVLLEDLQLIRGCDAIFMLDSWRESAGAKVEKAFAEALGKDVYHQCDACQLIVFPTE